MRDLLLKVENWFEEGESVALATVVKTWGSSPNPTGSQMFITGGGSCVEGAVIEKSKSVLENNSPCLIHYGVTDKDAWDVGLACGGEIDIFIQPLSRTDLTKLILKLGKKKEQKYWTIIKGQKDWIGKIIFDARDLPFYKNKNGFEVFENALTSSLEIILIGGAQIAVKLSELANLLGYDVTIIDPRKAFIQKERFPAFANIIHEWPDKALRDIQISKSTAIVTLSHDPKIDSPALLIALKSPAFYVGALGSLKTQKSLKQQLENAGLSKHSLNKLRGPVGLDINAKTPAEIALSILAEIIVGWRKK
jgi:xanthine dehydrogenase accessory factor